MDNELLLGLENFESIWARVSASMPEEGPPADPAGQIFPAGDPAQEEAALRDCLSLTAAHISLYGKLSYSCRGHTRTLLLRLLTDERRNLKKLQAEYFLLTGNGFAIPASELKAGGLLSALRSAYGEELENAQKLRALSAAAESVPRRELLFSLAESEEAHVRILRRIIESAM